MFAKLQPILIVADPIPAFLGAGVNDHKNAEVRRVLEPFVDMLGRWGVAMEAITHVGKSTKDKSATDQILGSVAYANLARRVNIAWLDPQTKGRYILTNPKLNIGPRQEAVAYTIEGFTYEKDGKTISTSRAKFEDSTFEADEDELRRGQKEIKRGKPGPAPEKTANVARWLLGYLRGQSGPSALHEVFDAAGALGYVGIQKPNARGYMEWSIREFSTTRRITCRSLRHQMMDGMLTT